ncbi:MAG: large subunit ribosomal protein [Patescibacteria group bacterium]|nr:large subunit ribosomal protein [Patescibacteria group bacterium]
MTTLEAQVRDNSQNVDALRKAGKMPAVFYGKKTESTPITIERKDFIKVWNAVGESGVVTIKTANGTVDALINAVDVDPVSDIPRHADFYVFEKGKKIEVDVPLEFVGVSPAVKDLGGSLVKTLHEIKISADPQHIPHHIEVDISSLVDFQSQILAGELVLPAGVVLVELPEEVVATAAAPKEDEPEETAPVDLSAIEVEKKGKKEEEGAGEGATEA